MKDKSFNLFETCGMHWENPYVDIITDGKSFNYFIVGWLLRILNKSVTSNFRRTIARREGHRFISCRMIAETNSTAQETRTITYQEIIHLCGKSRTNPNFFLSSQHNTLHYSISWEFPDPRCPKQGIFPAFIVQTLVLLSSNIQMCWLVLLASLSMLPIGCPWFTRSGTFVDS